MIAFAIRRLQPDDSLDELTGLLHRAFAPLGRLGLNCQGLDQSAATTRRRVERGDCLVAIADRRIVGTLTLERPDAAAPIAHYRSGVVASVHQFAVDPAYQRAGAGRSLLHVGLAWARTRRFAELALDTPAPATSLRAWYARQGFRPVDVVQLAGKSYRSAILSRTLAAPAPLALASAWPARHPAELAVLRQQALRGRGTRRAD